MDSKDFSNLFDFVKLCLTLFELRSYAQILCLFLKISEILHYRGTTVTKGTVAHSTLNESPPPHKTLGLSFPLFTLHTTGGGGGGGTPSYILSA